MTVSARLLNDKQLKDQFRELLKIFPEKGREVLLEVALVDIESEMKKNAIPVDTGRLRASIHTKFENGMVAGVAMKPETYKDDQGNLFDGKLAGSIDINSVIVGTNVEYASKINREGGGGKYSGRTAGGMKKPKGYGKAFFDIAVENGKLQLEREMQKLVNSAGGLV